MCRHISSLALLVYLLKSNPVSSEQSDYESKDTSTHSSMQSLGISAAPNLQPEPSAVNRSEQWAISHSPSTTRLPTTTRYEFRCHEAFNRTTVKDKIQYPDWYVLNYIVPFYAYKCAEPTLLVRGNLTIRVYDALADKQSLQPVDTRQMCRATLQESVFLFEFDFFDAFFGLPSPISTIARPIIIFRQLVLYACPLAFFTLLFGLHIIKRFLRESSGSYLYIILSTIVITDFLLYAFVALKGSRFQAVIALPLCYIGNIYLSFLPDAVADEILMVCMDAAYCVNQNIQAALAFDRFSALYLPIWYKAHMKKRTIVSIVGSIVGFNFAILVLELLSNPFFIQAEFSVAISSEQQFVYKLLSTVRLAARIILFVVSIIAQGVFCSATFYKVFQRTSGDVNAVANEQVRNQMKACKLLYGTCMLSLIGGVVQCTSLVARVVYHYAGATNGVSNVADVWQSAEKYQAIITPLCSSSGFYVHCCVSSAYRRIIRETRLGKAVIKLFSKCKPANSIEPAGH